MPTPVKAMDNMTKHLTAAEAEAREKAEQRSRPSRKPRAPRDFQPKTAERRIWDRVLQDMEGVDILDRLDTDMLETYCRQLVRAQELRENLAGQLRAEILAKSTVDLLKELRGLETTLLQYATRLGLTPESRARLARRAAEQEEADPDDDLFA